MPVSPDLGNSSAADVAELLSAYELALMESAAKALRGNQSDAAWAAAALQRIAQWRIAVSRGLPGAQRELADAVRIALAGAADAGDAAALADLPGLPAVAPLGLRGLHLATRRLTQRLAEALQQTPRLLELVLRESVSAGVAEVRAGQTTRRGGSQQVLDRLVRNGVTGFRDSAGRNWSLTSYAEMAVRTETQALALEAGENRIKQAGLDLIVISDSPRECELCRPFEGKVLSLDGPAGQTAEDVTRKNELTGEDVTVHVQTSLTHARARGFQHPNCTHSFAGFIPGVTKHDNATANPEGYEQKQKQRSLERHVREWKRAEVLALDPVARARAAAKVKEWQATLRTYVKDNDLKRQPGRESITKAV